MKVIILALAVMAVAQAQPSRRIVKVAAAAAVSEPPIRIGLNKFDGLEKGFDGRLGAIDSKDPIDLLGGTRGLYLDGYGAVFTTELSLVIPPGISPFRPKISKEDVASVHQRKLNRIPQLKDAMKEMVKMTALTLGQIPETQQIVLAVRLRYMLWEDTAGLPAQIVMKADRKSAAMGDIKTEIE